MLNLVCSIIGGLIEFTQDQSAVEKWTLTAHLRAAVRNNFQGLCEVIHSRDKNFTEKAISEDEEKIKKVVTAINENSNPFTINHSTKAMLKNIATGYLLKREYIEHILNAKSIGQAAVEEFIEVRLNERSVSFWKKVKKMNLYTFQSGKKNLKINKRSEPTIILKEHQLLFSRLLTVGDVRQVDLKEVLSHELCTIPLSLSYNRRDEKN